MEGLGGGMEEGQGGLLTDPGPELPTGVATKDRETQSPTRRKERDPRVS